MNVWLAGVLKAVSLVGSWWNDTQQQEILSPCVAQHTDLPRHSVPPNALYGNKGKMKVDDMLMMQMMVLLQAIWVMI